MEQSAFEAVMIGVNVFVFIIALTAAILLMSNIINMVNYANQNAITGMNGSLAESVGVVNDRTYTGNQLLTYYRKVEENKISDDTFKIKLANGGNEIELKNFVEEESLNNYLSNKFRLEFKGKTNDKNLYIFYEVVE